MSSKALPSLLAASLLTSLLTAGCYTVLKHPPSADLVDEERGTRRECYDCHDGADAYHFQDPFSLYYYDYYSPLWYPYYARPWWYSDFWYYSAPGETRDVETGGRHGWTRPTPTGRNPEAPPAVGTVPPVPSTGSAPPEKQPESDKPKEKEKEGRHQWTRGSAKGDRK